MFWAQEEVSKSTIKIKDIPVVLCIASLISK
jgi:hypothetical protein